ncbi:MAG TPA: hypothetical protein PLU71_04130 [Candidatus Dependentiae bacterium]|nr:hypothetical protein [Candidatus Dependentiae bacterium]HRQ63021.1 hypothetical protein [Candidatus Dependentiae bacterium]
MQARQPFNIMNALRFGFRQFKHNFLLLIGVSLLSVINIFVYQFVIQVIMKQQNIVLKEFFFKGIVHSMWVYGGNISGYLLILLFYILYNVIDLLITMGWIRIALDIYDNGTSSIQRILSTGPVLVDYYITALLYGLIVLGGLILFVIPGIYFAIRYSFALWYVVDTGCSPFEALRKSADLTRGNIKLLGLFLLICIGITLASVITIVGPIILSYTLFLSYGYIFRTLQEEQAGNIPVPIDVP